MSNKHSGQNEDGKLGGEVPRPPSDLERNPEAILETHSPGGH